MEKKTYITPEMEIMNIEGVEMIATSIGIDEEGEDYVVTGSNPRRGTWGNFWE